jgi:endonuclease/exonuclease/phosphatase family metal-dependent hydrolase
MSVVRSLATFVLVGFVAAAPGCIGVVDSTREPRIGGVVAGLTSDGLAVRLDGGATLSLDENGSFVFTEARDPGEPFDISIVSQPAGQSCVLLGGHGTVTTEGTPDVQVACSLVVGSFNLEWFSGTTDSGKKAGVAGVIRNAGFGLLGVEEVSSEQDLSDFAAQYLGSDWGAYVGNSGDLQRVGLLYRTELVTVVSAGELVGDSADGLIDPTRYPWAGLRLPYHAVIETSAGTRFHFVGVHFKAMADATSCQTRAAQVANLEEWLARHEDEAVVVTGDFNDQLAGYGICTGVDTLAPFQADTQLTFLTAAPYMSENYYSAVNYHSTIDHILVTAPMLALIEDLDTSGHKAQIFMHHSTGISDHQPPYAFVRW